MGYYWTDNKVDWTAVDALLLACCYESGEGAERFTERAFSAADLPEGSTPFYSVYVHRTGEGAQCIADRDTYRQAYGFAEALSRARHALPINDYTPEDLRK